MLTIGQLAAYAGVTVRAVRHYHQVGLLPEPERDASGCRLPPELAHRAQPGGAVEENAEAAWRLASEAGASFAVGEASSLELDVDTPDDLAALRQPA